ncbi:MAG: putative arabinose efflux permease, family [Jatrophihabitantaceae bacterium]|nr:putative arabinose efflux permease, family [Jatrophihabitantaceae bacterium]
MDLSRYRRVLARPGVRAVLLTSLVARMPIISAPIVLTLHVVLDLDRGFSASGLVAGAFAIGSAIGSPQLGRAMDRVGLRPVLCLATVVAGVFWLTAAHLPFWALVPAAFVGGLLPIPVYTITRQSLAALLLPDDRQAGFSLDSMAVELSFATAPAVAIVLMTQTSPTLTLWLLGVLIVGAGIGLLIIDPPIHGRPGDNTTEAAAGAAAARAAAVRPPMRAWLNVDVAAVLLMAFATTFTVMGTDVAITAVMRSFDRVALIGPVFGVWCLASLVGGFVYGAGRRIDPILLLAALAALCIPVALAPNWWILLIAVIPTGLLCAPMLVTTTDEIVRRTPEAVRGQALGLNGSALTVGNALGSPCIGLVVDHSHPRLGFVAIGVLGLGLAAVLAPLNRRTAAQPVLESAAAMGATR